MLVPSHWEIDLERRIPTNHILQNLVWMTFRCTLETAGLEAHTPKGGNKRFSSTLLIRPGNADYSSQSDPTPVCLFRSIPGFRFLHPVSIDYSVTCVPTTAPISDQSHDLEHFLKTQCRFARMHRPSYSFLFLIFT